MKIEIYSATALEKKKELLSLGRRKLGEKASIPPIMFAPLEGKKLGYYDLLSNQIVISEDLLSSACLASVFLHELAHYVQYRNFGYSSHDSTFRKIASSLGLDEGFDKAKVAISESERSRMRTKADKLMRLSSSPFSAESKEAYKKAQEIMAKYSLSEKEEERIYRVVLTDKKRMLAAEKMIGTAVALLTGAFIIRDMRDGVRVLSAYGSLFQVESALYFYSYFTSELKAEEKRARECVRDFDSSSFAAGLAENLLKRIRGNADSSSCALEIARSRNEKKYRQISGFSIRRSRSRYSVSSRESYSAGSCASERLTLTRSAVKRIEC